MAKHHAKHHEEHEHHHKKHHEEHHHKGHTIHKGKKGGMTALKAKVAKG